MEKEKWVKLSDLEEFFINIKPARADGKTFSMLYFMNGMRTVIEYAETVARNDVKQVKTHQLASLKIEKCANCGRVGLSEWKYCPYCGTLMGFEEW